MSVRQYTNGRLSFIAGPSASNEFTGTRAEVLQAIADGIIKEGYIVNITDDVTEGAQVLDGYDEIMANTDPGKAAGALGVKEGFERLGGFSFQTVDGEKQVSVDGGLTWENFSNAPSHILYSSAGNKSYTSGCTMIFVDNGATSYHHCKNNNSYTFGDVSLKVSATSANASSYYEITNNGNKVVNATNLYDNVSNNVEIKNYAINSGETLKIYGMTSTSSCVFMW